MSFLQPWAWAGLVTLALPVVIHLLGRGRARVIPFPSLRFLPAARLLPARRTRLQDVLLLVVRALVLAAAVAALTQPRFGAGAGTRESDTIVARAIVVDTSASMLRATTAGGSALAAARRRADSITTASAASVVIETAEPARVLAGAAAWLTAQPMRRELVLVSDFQTQELGPGLRVLSADVVVTLSRVPVVASATLPAALVRQGTSDMAPMVRATPESTSVSWRAAGTGTSAGLVVLAGADERDAAAAQRAAAVLGVELPLDAALASRVAIVFPRYAGRVALLRAGGPIRLPWQAQVAAALRGDSLLASTARDATVADSGVARALVVASAPVVARELVLARDHSGVPAVFAASEPAAQGDRLLLFANVNAASATAAALMVAVRRARSRAPPSSELDASFIPDNALRAMERATPAAVARTAAESGQTPTHARVFWIAALLLLTLEWMLRRRHERRSTPRLAREVPYDAAA